VRACHEQKITGGFVAPIEAAARIIEEAGGELKQALRLARHYVVGHRDRKR
jgi:hypothetical protein